MRKLLTVTLTVTFMAAGVTTATQATTRHTTTNHTNHTNKYHPTFHYQPWHFPKSMPAIRRYRIIAAHDQWWSQKRNLAMVRQSASLTYVNQMYVFHRRELNHARAHIKRILAKQRAAQAARHTLPAWYIALGNCESGNDWHYNDGQFEGEINFLNSTWLTYGGGRYAPHAYEATRWEQYLVTLAMHRDVPWSQSNPACSARLGL